jgi:hypothetical protein
MKFQCKCLRISSFAQVLLCFLNLSYMAPVLCILNLSEVIFFFIEKGQPHPLHQSMHTAVFITCLKLSEYQCSCPLFCAGQIRSIQAGLVLVLIG